MCSMDGIHMNCANNKMTKICGTHVCLEIIETGGFIKTNHHQIIANRTFRKISLKESRFIEIREREVIEII